MNDFKDNFQLLLNPEILKEKLILISLFIAVYENFKSTIVNSVKYFYWSGFKNGKDQFEYYEQNVLSKVTSEKNRQIKATLFWLKEAGAMTVFCNKKILKSAKSFPQAPVGNFLCHPCRTSEFFIRSLSPSKIKR